MLIAECALKVSAGLSFQLVETLLPVQRAGPALERAHRRHTVEAKLPPAPDQLGMETFVRLPRPELDVDGERLRCLEVSRITELATVVVSNEADERAPA